MPADRSLRTTFTFNKLGKLRSSSLFYSGLLRIGPDWSGLLRIDGLRIFLGERDLTGARAGSEKARRFFPPPAAVFRPYRGRTAVPSQCLQGFCACWGGAVPGSYRRTGNAN